MRQPWTALPAATIWVNMQHRQARPRAAEKPERDSFALVAVKLQAVCVCTCVCVHTWPGKQAQGQLCTVLHACQEWSTHAKLEYAPYLPRHLLTVLGSPRLAVKFLPNKSLHTRGCLC